MSATLIDGKAAAARYRATLAGDVAALKQQHGLTPTLAVVLVGEDPASAVYVRNKEAALAEVGMASQPTHLPAHTSQAALLALIGTLNNDQNVHGILVQMPLPKHMDSQLVLQAIDPRKDVDGFHPVNVGLLACAMPGLVPCTPQGCLLLLQQTLGNLTGKHALVVGRSTIVGKPMAQLLLQADCTVTIAHSRSHNLPGLCGMADIVVAAIGKPEAIQGDWIKQGATVVDVGINRIMGADGKTRLVGDVAFAAAATRAAFITPVPGGVGPMTIACLLGNTLKAAKGLHDGNLEPAPHRA